VSGETGDDRVNILLVDDRPGNLVSLRGVLEGPSYNLVLANSGEEALALILRHEFAVILMDVAMPRIDGFEVAATIKQRERFKYIPIIFVTASVQNIEWIFKAYSVGAVDFLAKPLDAHAVRSKVAVFVQLFLQRKQLERQAVLLKESERRERELEVTRLKLENERRYRNLAESIPHVVWTAGPEGDLQYVNHRWSEITGMSDARSVGTGWHAALHPEDVAALVARWNESVSAGREFEMDCRLRQANGTPRWYLCRGLPEKEGDGRIARWLGTFTDVDAQRRAHEGAQAAVRLRDEFLSVASHELRTPLTALQLQLQSARRLFTQSKEVNERLLNKVSTAVRQTERLSTLVDSLLDVSRIATGRLELHLEDFDLAEATNDVVERLREEAGRAGCEVRLHVKGSVTGHWDRLRIEQVVTNLLSNALKYAPGKPVEITLGPSEEGAALTVRDQGIGIDPEHFPRIFGRFERAVPASHYGGLGLGLYITQQIISAHGGQVTVDSAPGSGATFRVQLPLSSAQREREAESWTGPGAPGHEHPHH
jgi:PAS domain S-box-containing protein